MAFSCSYALIALLLLFKAPALNAKPVKEVIVILNRPNQFSVLIKLLQDTGLLDAIQGQIDAGTSFSGITVFAPTDAAFRKLPPGFIENLSLSQKTLLLQNLVVPQFYTFDGLAGVTGPLFTFSGFPLNIVDLQPRRPFVSTGSVTTAVKNPLTEEFPASVFPVFDVLLPPGL
uniref:Putative cell surface adhesion protein n=1 Tax=Wolffia arrhiza TaxID=161111 RepID=G4WMT8_WOLAR|nr:putative cell surface adhesion protein [Wolffia arrhiza]